jgi:hypothetical protein
MQNLIFDTLHFIEKYKKMFLRLKTVKICNIYSSYAIVCYLQSIRLIEASYTLFTRMISHRSLEKSSFDMLYVTHSSEHLLSFFSNFLHRKRL